MPSPLRTGRFSFPIQSGGDVTHTSRESFTASGFVVRAVLLFKTLKIVHDGPFISTFQAIDEENTVEAVILMHDNLGRPARKMRSRGAVSIERTGSAFFLRSGCPI